MGLFTPAWKSNNEKRALRSIEKMTDPEKLKRVVKEAENRYVRKAAVEKLTDQNVLADVAKNDSDSDVRKAAVEKLTDQNVLADVAKNSNDRKIRRISIKKLDNEHLADLLDFCISKLGDTYINREDMNELLFICSISKVLTRAKWMTISGKLKNVQHYDSPHYDSGSRSHTDAREYIPPHQTPTGHWSSSDCEHTDRRSSHVDIKHSDIKNGKDYFDEFPPYIKD
jgi:hypothetical protein